MPETIKDRSEISDQYKWDLTRLFATDKAWEQEGSVIKKLTQKALSHKGKLDNAEEISAYLEDETELNRHLSNYFAYASMRQSEDTRQPEAQSMYARAYGTYVEAETSLSFAEPEILKLSEEKLKEISADPALKDYQYTMTRLLRSRPHVLDENSERILASFGEVMAVPRNVSSALMDADLTFDRVKDSSGTEHEVTGSSYIMLQSSPDRTLRRNSFESFYRGYKGHINTFAAAYSGEVKSAVLEAELRHYSSSREMYALGEQVPPVVCEQLIDAVRAGMDKMYRYVSLRKKILGVDELHYYDMYAPLASGTPAKYTYEQAEEMVLSALAPLGKKYTDTVRHGFDSRWIDVYPNKGKQGGAYSEGTYDSDPYIMANFTGTLDSVSTIAHEMGHSMHTYIANHAQKPQNADYTIFVAEVASTVNENLLVEYLLSKCKDPNERMALLNQYLEGFKGTVYRQTMFAEFEKRAHEAAQAGEALNAEKLDGIYNQLIHDYFGPELKVDEQVQYEWARIPHFYSPFYVYKYATSYCAAVAISQAILKEGQPAVDRYLKFLSTGGSMDPIDELKIAGVDFTTPEPVAKALERFDQVLDQAEALLQ